ncbi:MAG: S1 RNA-binding domain-containing protein [Lachnospiraceae bacterium]|nr:S1 RNA-binding domain-containing protein [Lachnospiraceae bacterium]
MPSMDEFKDEIDHSFRRLKEGDIVNGTVIGVSDSAVTVDLNSYSEGVIPLEELSNDPRFSIKSDIAIGEKISATIIKETKDGVFVLSLKAADDVLAWDKLEETKREETVEKIKVAEAVKGGVTTYLYGIRAFIPASQLALSYVEDTSTYVGKELDVIVTEVDREKKKLVLSAKSVLREKAAADRRSRIGRLQTGLVTTGTVEKITPFGAFVNIGEDLSGLVHISQVCSKRIKSVNEVLKEGDEVTVKILDVKDGKISLSIKAAYEKDESEIYEDAVDDAAEGYSDGDAPTTSLASLLKGFDLPNE